LQDIIKSPILLQTFKSYTKMGNTHSKKTTYKAENQFVEKYGGLKKEFLTMDDTKQNELISYIKAKTGKSNTEILIEIHQINNIR